MTQSRDVARIPGLPGILAGGDGTGPLFGIPADEDGRASMVAAVVADLRPMHLIEEFLHTYEVGDWSVLVVVSCYHPNLVPLAKWAKAQGDVLFLAGVRGPQPPAIMAVDRAHKPRPRAHG